VNLQAVGPAAVLGVLFICIAVVGVLGSGETADKALNVLTISVGLLVLPWS
jgi:hypothetical protein